MDYLENKSIDRIIEELEIVISRLSELKTPKTESVIEWSGLIGVIQDSIRDKRINKLLYTIIIDDVNYLNLGGYIIRSANTVAHICKEDNSSDQDRLLRQCVEAQKLLSTCYNGWEAVFPHLMSYGVADDEKVGKNLTLGLSTRYYMYQAFDDFILPEKLKEDNSIIFRNIKRDIEQRSLVKESSGCLGVFLALLIPTTFLSLFIF